MTAHHDIRRRLAEIAARELELERQEVEALRAQVAERERIARETAEKEAKQKQRESKRNLLSFVEMHNPRYHAGWVHRDICERLQRFSADVAAGKSPRLMLFMPPRHGKSEIVSRRFPVWHMGHNPHHEIILASYGADLAATMSLSARQAARDSAEWWPSLVPGEKWTSEEWSLKAGGIFRSTGVRGPTTGKGAHIAIIDDPVKDAEEAGSPTIKARNLEWYQSTLYTRLAPGGGVLILMTRWAEDDLAGKLLEAQKSGGDVWQVVNYPAIAEQDEPHRKAGEALHPERRDIAELNRIKANLSGYWWAALYQQRPTPSEGSIFKREWFNQRYTALPTLDDTIISCDLTFKNSDGADYVVLQVWGRKGPDVYLIDQVRARMDYPATRQAIRDLRAKYPRTSAVVVEDKANGPAIIAELRKEIVGVVPWDPGRSSKAERAQVLSVPRYAAGQVHLPQNAAWIGDFVEEHIGFGAGAVNDDQVDAESQALGWWQERSPKASAKSFGWLPVDTAPGSW